MVHAAAPTPDGPRGDDQGSQMLECPLVAEAGAPSMHRQCGRAASGSRHTPVGELVALLASALADVREVEEDGTAAGECTMWVLEWWARLEPHLPISTGSLLAAGRSVPREDPMPILHQRAVPENASEGEESVDALTEGTPRGPPPPQPVRPLLSQSPTDEDLLLAAEAMERAQRLQGERESEQALQEALEEAHEKEMEIAYEMHRAATYRDWEEWVLQQELARPAKRSRGMLQVVARTGNQGEPGVSSTLQVPLDAEAGGTLTLQLHFHEAEPTTPSTLPAHEVGPRAEAPASCGSAGLNPYGGGQALTGPVNATVADTAEDPVDAWLEAREQLDGVALDGLDVVYRQWVAGLLTAEEIVRRHGQAALSLLQVQRMAYFDGALAFRLDRANAARDAGGGHRRRDVHSDRGD